LVFGLRFKDTCLMRCALWNYYFVLGIFQCNLCGVSLKGAIFRCLQSN
jgi:hypothetical protein